MTMARPMPKPKASAWTSDKEIREEVRTRRLNSMRRETSPRTDSRPRAARSRPVQNTFPRARMRRTRARGLGDSERSSASMASNMGPVTSLPWSGLLRVKVRTWGVRWISIRGGGLDMAGRLYRELLRRSRPFLPVVRAYKIYTASISVPSVVFMHPS